MNKQDKTILFIVIAVTIITVIGSTFAYFTWVSNTSQRTTVSFTSGAGFSCSANGGGNITSNDIHLAPTTCTDTARAIKRTVTVSPTITQNDGAIYLDMWLKVNSIGTGLSNSQNFKYALTTSGTSCTSGTVVAQGNFNGTSANDQIPLLHEKAYSQTTTDTYYLWIWLDAAEEDPSTQGQSFNISLGGVCTNQAPNYVYTANIYDGNATGWNSVWLGQTMPSGITEYSTKEAAMAALKTAGGGSTDYPFFLRHKKGDGSLWCATAGSNNYCIYQTQTECNNEIADDFGNDWTCQQSTYTNGVSESYVGFVVTSTIASANPGMTAGTYYLKGGDNGRAYNENKATLLSAFGSSKCKDYSSSFGCSVSGLSASANSNGGVNADGHAGSYCEVGSSGISGCEVFVMAEAANS